MNESDTIPEVTELLHEYWRKYVECKNQHNDTTFDNTTKHCSAFYDGYLCWPPTLAGDIARKNCPSNVIGWDERRTAFRECLEDGRWFRHPKPPYKEWSNYTLCVDYEDFSFRQFINNLYIIGYSVSLAAIIISLVIFLSFRNLRCTRISIHIHLFLSFVLNNVTWLIWYKAVVPMTDVLSENPAWCQGLHLIIEYLMVANYMWMFCEGLHLHLALVVVFVEDKIAMKCFIVLGWILPLILVAIYGAVRGASPEDCTKCWITESNCTWILFTPVIVSLIASMVFLINVVRVLLTKLHPSSARPAPLGMRKAVRATLILVPLFGLHFILIPFRPDRDSPAEHAYQTLSAVIISLQGFCVACLFCFANHDVLQTISDRFRSFTGAHFDSMGAGANGTTNTKDVVV